MQHTKSDVISHQEHYIHIPMARMATKLVSWAIKTVLLHSWRLLSNVILWSSSCIHSKKAEFDQKYRTVLKRTSSVIVSPLKKERSCLKFLKNASFKNVKATLTCFGLEMLLHLWFLHVLHVLVCIGRYCQWKTFSQCCCYWNAESPPIYCHLVFVHKDAHT